MHRFFAFFIFSICAFSVSGQTARPGFDLSNYGVKVEPDKRLMVVLAALETATVKNSAGVDEKLINTPLSEKSAAFRQQLLADNAGMPEDLRRKISSFIIQFKKSHPKATDADLISPFISMAYTLTPVPELADPIITTDLPGTLLDVLDFAPLVREFYRRSPIGARLDEYAKQYNAESDGILRVSARDMVSDILDYLHTRPRLVFTEKIKVETTKTNSKSGTLRKVETREHDRHFFIVPEKLSPKGNTNFLNIRDDYYVIVSPDTDLSSSGARRAFLQFVVDPIVLENAKEVSVVRDWAKPILDERRKVDPEISPDVFLSVSRSLVAAIDIRQSEYVRGRIATDQVRQKQERLKTKAEKQAAYDELVKYKESLADEAALQLYDDYEKGSVLAYYFAEQLKGVEDSGFDIASSFKDMIASFDPAKETARVVGTLAARKRATALREDRKNRPEARPIDTAENPVTTKLIEIQKVIESKDYLKAGADLKQLLAQNPSEPRIYYNIGRLAGLTAAGIEDREEQAKKLYEAKIAYTNALNAATDATDPALLSLTYVALARIFEFDNNIEYALKLYDQAIRLREVKGGGYLEAIDAKRRLIQP
ncbi:hypothetical protein BH10ACI2_BH10ACI2_15760 [soil metagenome]